MTGDSPEHLDEPSDDEVCIVCGDPIPDDVDGKWDPMAPVYADDFVYHLGCEDGVFDSVCNEVNPTDG